MGEGFAFHHVGVAVPALQPAIDFYKEAFRFEVISGPFEDPIQDVKVCFLGPAGAGSAPIELISPRSSASPVNGYLSKGIGAYHVCFETDEIKKALAELWRKGCVVISEPVPAVAFGGRRIAWCFTPARQLIELLECAPLVEVMESK